MVEQGNPDVSSDTSNDFSDIFSLLENLPLENNESKESKLLTSLKPYLNKKRQKKLAQCEKLMSFADTFKMLNDLHIFDSFLKDTDE